MNQLVTIWKNFSRAQKATLVLVPIALVIAIFSFVNWKHDADFRVLYSNLAPEDAAAITQKMREGAIEFRLDETGSTVSVPSQKIAEARLSLAGAGLPKTGRIGFEIFDRNNLGTTDFAEQVNFRRALEGELERTLATLAQIDQARVHITVAKDSVFLESRQPSKATVVIKMKRSGRLAQASIAAISNLVASAVEGLTPDRVAVIDSSGQLLSRVSATDDSGAQLADANLDYRRRMESELLAKVNLSLGPLLGENRFRAGINVDCDFTTSEQSDETLDPNGSVISTSQSTEESNVGATAAGVPGAASNLPRPVSRPSNGTTGTTRRTENLAYQTSRTTRHTVTPRGAIKKISAAVLIDQTVRWEGTGAKMKRVLVPPSPEVLKGVRDIVAGTLGINEQRGDLVTVETLPFETTLASEPPGAAPPAVKTENQILIKQNVIIGGVAVGVVVLVAAVFLLRNRKKRPVTAEDQAAAALAGGVPGAAVLGSTEQRMESQMHNLEAQQAQMEEEAMSRIKLPPSSKATEVLLRHVRDAITKDSSGVSNVLRSWVKDIEVRKG